MIIRKSPREIEGMARAGRVVAGTLGGCDVVAFAGRFHLYEGHPPRLAALPVRLAHALGARTLFVSNAAGGIRRTFHPGDLMLIRDHINLMWRNPLIGPVGDGEERFPDMSEPYDAKLLALLREAALEVGLPVVEGVYAGLLGPSYETPAEVRMLERLGADAVGMSTIPEVLVARALGMRVAGVSCITNLAAGIAPTPLARLAHISIAWVLINWWSHDSFHIANGLDLGGLLVIEYAYHVTLMTAGAIAAAWFVAVLRTSRLAAAQ
jgi:purine-nucleoside phosphorylase